MSPELKKRLSGWIYLRGKDERLEEALALDLTEAQLYGLAAGVVLLDAGTEAECGKFVDELCELGVDRKKFMISLDRAGAAIMEPDPDEDP